MIRIISPFRLIAVRLIAVPLLLGCVAPAGPVQRELPPRAPNAISGTAFIHAVAPLPREEREAAILRELLAGNVPAFLRSFRTLRLESAGADSARHVVEYAVMPDYLAIGSDGDYVRMPMSPHTAQAFADAYGFVLLTRRMSNDIWLRADVRLEPRPLTEERESPLSFLEHHRIIEAQLVERGTRRGALVAGHKKDVVVTNRLRERAGRVAIYGWHHPDGRPIQPLYVGHVDWYVDYSHGLRLARRAMTVDGVPTTFEAILSDSVLWPLLSDEGPIRIPRYERPLTAPDTARPRR